MNLKLDGIVSNPAGLLVEQLLFVDEQTGAVSVLTRKRVIERSDSVLQTRRLSQQSQLDLRLATKTFVVVLAAHVECQMLRSLASAFQPFLDEIADAPHMIGAEVEIAELVRLPLEERPDAFQFVVEHLLHLTSVRFPDSGHQFFLENADLRCLQLVEVIWNQEERKQISACQL